MAQIGQCKRVTLGFFFGDVLVGFEINVEVKVVKVENAGIHGITVLFQKRNQTFELKFAI